MEKKSLLLNDLIDWFYLVPYTEKELKKIISEINEIFKFLDNHVLQAKTLFDLFNDLIKRASVIICFFEDLDLTSDADISEVMFNTARISMTSFFSSMISNQNMCNVFAIISRVLNDKDAKFLSKDEVVIINNCMIELFQMAEKRLKALGDKNNSKYGEYSNVISLYSDRKDSE